MVSADNVGAGYFRKNKDAEYMITISQAVSHASKRNDIPSDFIRQLREEAIEVLKLTSHPFWSEYAPSHLKEKAKRISRFIEAP